MPRYFVTAANASIILFLKDAAVEYLTFTGSNGNKISTPNLKNSDKLVALKGDALMYYHVYDDLIMLSKSTELGKSVIDMNEHYLELRVPMQNSDCVLSKAFKSSPLRHNSTKTISEQIIASV